ncbi:MAG: hypothetical protein V1676_05540 [Candidatus Diapherotrites archaeon]
MRHFCPKCYGKSFCTVPLKEAKDGVFVCTADARHSFTINDGYPVSKKL